jgi:hypothetical protein
MDTARLESLCFVYAGILLSVAGVVLAWTQSDLSWLVIYSTGPLFVVFGIHRLRTPSVSGRATTVWAPGSTPCWRLTCS